MAESRLRRFQRTHLSAQFGGGRKAWLSPARQVVERVASRLRRFRRTHLSAQFGGGRKAWLSPARKVVGGRRLFGWLKVACCASVIHQEAAQLLAAARV